ncbi:MAG TPA: ABC transporter permease [Candidatus Limiplasma sp.]|nr:ABC transporter permease [Candidatus Limiplasma sp.]
MKKFLKSLLRWETMLIVLLVALYIIFDWKDAVNVASGTQKKDAFNLVKLVKGIQPYMLYSFMMLGMMLILAMGDIDISVGATGALSAAVLFVTYGAFTGAGMAHWLAFVLALLLCIGTGTVCGMLNGLLVSRFKELFSMIITLSTMLFFRGLCYLLLGGNTLTFKDDATFDLLKNLNKTVAVGSLSVPVIIFWFLLFSLGFFIVLHMTSAGRKLFAVGTNPSTSRFSGIRVDRIRFIAFTICGALSALSAIFYVGSASRSIRADAMEGYEMYAIAAAVLAGFSTSGGKGNVAGGILSVLIFGVMKKGLGTVFSLPDSTVNLAVGAVLILSVLIPNIMQDISTHMRLHRQQVQLEKAPESPQA